MTDEDDALSGRRVCEEWAIDYQDGKGPVVDRRIRVEAWANHHNARLAEGELPALALTRRTAITWHTSPWHEPCVHDWLDATPREFTTSIGQRVQVGDPNNPPADICRKCGEVRLKGDPA